MYHTMTAVPGGGAVIMGGRTSPFNPIDGVLRVTYSQRNSNVLISITEMVCTGPAPISRWRHTATLLTFKGMEILLLKVICFFK